VGWLVALFAPRAVPSFIRRIVSGRVFRLAFFFMHQRGAESVIGRFQRWWSQGSGSLELDVVASPSSWAFTYGLSLKTIIPSRKATKQYLGEESDDHED
jgi:hypothetical protein